MTHATAENQPSPEIWLGGLLAPPLDGLKAAQERLAAADPHGKFEAVRCAIELGEKELNSLVSRNDLPFAVRLEEAIAQLRQSGLAMTLQNFCRDTAVTSQQAMQCLCVLREACANAIKHGDSTRIAVVAMQDAGHFILSISDQGKGIQGNATTCGGIGMDNMKRRASVLGGEMRNIPNHLGGLTLELRFPTGVTGEAGAGSENPLHQLGQTLHDGYCQCLVGALFTIEMVMESLSDREHALWQRARLLESKLRRHLGQVRQLSHELCAHWEGAELPSLRDVS